MDAAQARLFGKILKDPTTVGDLYKKDENRWVVTTEEGRGRESQHRGTVRELGNPGRPQQKPQPQSGSWKYSKLAKNIWQ